MRRVDGRVYVVRLLSNVHHFIGTSGELGNTLLQLHVLMLRRNMLLLCWRCSAILISVEARGSTHLRVGVCVSVGCYDPIAIAIDSESEIAIYATRFEGSWGEFRRSEGDGGGLKSGQNRGGVEVKDEQRTSGSQKQPQPRGFVLARKREAAARSGGGR